MFCPFSRRSRTNIAGTGDILEFQEGNIYIYTYIFCVVCMVRLIFAKGMNNRNTFVFVLCVPRFAVDVPFNGCVFNITPQRASDDDNPPVCFLMFNDYIQQTQRSFIFCSAQPVES